LRPEQYYALPSITRFVDHIQNLPAIAGLPGAPTPIAFALSDAPKIERAAEVSLKKKEKAAKGDLSAAPANNQVPGAGNVSQSAPEGVVAVGGKGGKGGKKDKKAPAAAGEEAGGKKSKSGGPAPVPASAADAGEPAPSMIDLRVGKIIQGAFLP
jgi:aminoacyl tRNA synthase complex-interacting multifunctional protein 1